jgi:hypothetical protein
MIAALHLSPLGARATLFIAEGEKISRRAVDSRYRRRSFLLAGGLVEGLHDVFKRWPAVRSSSCLSTLRNG